MSMSVSSSARQRASGQQAATHRTGGATPESGAEPLLAQTRAVDSSTQQDMLQFTPRDAGDREFFYATQGAVPRQRAGPSWMRDTAASRRSRADSGRDDGRAVESWRQSLRGGGGTPDQSRRGEHASTGAAAKGTSARERPATEAGGTRASLTMTLSAVDSPLAGPVQRLERARSRHQTYSPAVADRAPLQPLATRLSKPHLLNGAPTPTVADEIRRHSSKHGQNGVESGDAPDFFHTGSVGTQAPVARPLSTERLQETLSNAWAQTQASERESPSEERAGPIAPVVGPHAGFFLRGTTTRVDGAILPDASLKPHRGAASRRATSRKSSAALSLRQTKPHTETKGDGEHVRLRGPQDDHHPVLADTLDLLGDGTRVRKYTLVPAAVSPAAPRWFRTSGQRLLARSQYPDYAVAARDLRRAVEDRTGRELQSDAPVSLKHAPYLAGRMNPYSKFPYRGRVWLRQDAPLRVRYAATDAASGGAASESKHGKEPQPQHQRSPSRAARGDGLASPDHSARSSARDSARGSETNSARQSARNSASGGRDLLHQSASAASIPTSPIATPTMRRSRSRARGSGVRHVFATPAP